MMKPLIVKRGQTFVHNHFLDPEQLTYHRAIMVITAVRKGVVYYTYDGHRRGAWRMSVDRFIKEYGDQLFDG